jgi:hypothetical protein
MKAAAAMARSTKNPFAIFGLSGSIYVNEPPAPREALRQTGWRTFFLCHFVGPYVRRYLASRHDQTFCQ